MSKISTAEAFSVMCVQESSVEVNGGYTYSWIIRVFLPIFHFERKEAMSFEKPTASPIAAPFTCSLLGPGGKATMFGPEEGSV